MKKLALLFACVMLFSACANTPPEVTDTPATDPITEAPTDEVTTAVEYPVVKPLEIHKISELNTTEYPLDSAAGEENSASLVLNYRESYTLKAGNLGGVKAYYTRIKKINDSAYIMTFHNGQYGGSVYCMRSSDLMSWSTPVTVFKQGYVTVNGVRDNLKYMTPDSCVLKDGRILAVTSFRAEKAYEKEVGENGLAISFSSDNGKTWTEPQVVYRGTNWEPCVLEADNGEIYIYFSCTAPSIVEHGFDDRSSGVGLIRSLDGGKTWIPNVTESPYTPQYVMRCYVTTINGIKRYNDQMPVALQLNNGTIALAVETKTPSASGSNSFKFSISYNNDGYQQWLGMDETGPSNRKTKLFNLAGPYLSQFDSGEVLLTYHWSGTFRYRIGNCTATQFSGETTLWTDTGMWGASEKITSHSAVVTVCTEEFEAKVGRLYLNHRLNAYKLTPTLTANTAEWDASTDAAFLGSESQAQAAVRFAYDDDYIYVLGERLDNYITDKDKLFIYFHDGNTGYYSVGFSNDGIKVERKENAKASVQTLDAEALGIKFYIAVDGQVNDLLGDNDNGVVYELAFPRELLKTEDGTLAYHFRLVNSDSPNGKTTSEDSHSSAGMNNTNDWGKVTLK